MDGDHFIREMAVGDLGATMALAASLPETPRWELSAYLAALEPGGLPRRIALVAVDSNEAVVGFAVGSVVAPVAELESIGVSHLNQGQGIGGALLRALRKALGEAGAEEILLEVRASNRRAIGFYEAAGFLEVGRRAGYYAGSEAGAAEDALVMRSELCG